MANPSDKTLKSYCMRLHQLDSGDGCWRELRISYEYDKLDDRGCEYLPIEEFEKTSYSRKNAKDAKLAGILSMILGIFTFFTMTIPLLQSLGK